MQGLSAKASPGLPGAGGSRAALVLKPGRRSRRPAAVADMGQMDADLVGAAGLQPACDQARDRLAVGCPGKRSSTCQWVMACAAAGAHRHLVAGVRMAAERRVDRAFRRGPARPRRTPDSRARAAPVRPWSANCAASARWARSVLATTMRPVVSLSRRCTMPGRLTPPMPDRLSPQWAISALTSVPVAVAGGRMHDQPGRLVDDDDLVVLVHDRRAGCASPLGLGRFGRRHRRPRRFAGVDAIARIADRARRRS